ncbi:MAG: PAS domain-containing protein, partial [Cellulomonas sp.]|nr:PAS domain-containing protein [Cellulomonas sp.]
MIIVTGRDEVVLGVARESGAAAGRACPLHPAGAGPSDTGIFRTVVDTSPVGLAVVEHDGCVTYVNPAMLQVTHCAKDQFGAWSRGWLAPPDRGEVAGSADAERVEAQGSRLVTVERHLELVDGTSIRAMVEFTQLSGGDGAPSTHIRLTDVTERHRLETELRVAEAQYRVLVERIPAIVYTAEPG